MMQLSPSLLDAYAYWRAGTFDTERERRAREAMLAAIRRDQTEPSEPMRLGRAFHEALGLPVIGADRVTVEGLCFDASSLRQVRDKLPTGTVLEAAGELTLPEIDVWLKVFADGVVGGVVHEIKTTSSRINVDKYTHSMQWRCYLLAFAVSVVTYHVCKLRFDKKRETYVVAQYLPFQQFAYPGMRDDVIGAARQVRDFIREMGLESYRLTDTREETIVHADC